MHRDPTRARLHDVARLPGRSALSDVDDETYFDVLTNDILHVQQRLAALAHGTERVGRRLLSAGASYTERDLKAIAQTEQPSAAKVALNEILADKQMMFERAVLQSTAKASGAKRLDDTSDHVAPSLSRLPYFYALVERLQALHEQAGKPPIPTPPPTSAAAVTPTPTPMPTPKPPAGGSAAGSADVTLAAQRSALVTELGQASSLDGRRDLDATTSCLAWCGA